MNKAEKQWMLSIQKAYLTAFPRRTLPPALLMKDQLQDRDEKQLDKRQSIVPASKYEEPYRRPVMQDLNPLRWIIEINRDSPQADLCQSLVKSICTYQHERIHRRNRFKKGRLDDPINLFLEEWKEFLLLLSTIESAHERYKVFRARTVYLETLIKDASLASSKLHVVLGQIHAKIRAGTLSVQQDLFAEMVAQHMSQLEEDCRNVLKHGILFALLAFRNTLFPHQLLADLDTLRRPDGLQLRKVMQSVSGQCVDLLLRTPQFLQIFPSTKISEAWTGGGENSFVSAKGAAMLPNKVGLALLGTSTSERAGDPSRPIQGCVEGSLFRAPAGASEWMTLGLCSAFIDNQPAMRSFVLLHGYLWELARILTHIPLARKVKGQEFLRYKNANLQLGNLLKLISSIRELITEYIDTCGEAASTYNSTLETRSTSFSPDEKSVRSRPHRERRGGRRKQDRNEEDIGEDDDKSEMKELNHESSRKAQQEISAWKTNYRAAGFLLTRLKNDLRSCGSLCTTLLSDLQSNWQDFQS